jgi:hypothetical protein
MRCQRNGSSKNNGLELVSAGGLTFKSADWHEAVLCPAYVVVGFSALCEVVWDTVVAGSVKSIPYLLVRKSVPYLLVRYFTCRYPPSSKGEIYNGEMHVILWD